jgi:isocitrate dehydrogenase kinase/phosphatase
MQLPDHYSPIAKEMALTLVEGFNQHYSRFRACSAQAKSFFEQADWHGTQAATAERVTFYDYRVAATIQRLKTELKADLQSDDTWQQTKLYFIGLLINHRQPELAETFFNSVCCRILHKDYFNNHFIFIRPAISTEHIKTEKPAYRSYYLENGNLGSLIQRLLGEFNWRCPFQSMARDTQYIINAFKEADAFPVKTEPNFQIQILQSAFYRNKAAYIFGILINGHTQTPFAIPVLQTSQKTLIVDTVLLEPWHISILFSFSRAHFLVDMEVPSAYVSFLKRMMPSKTPAELYTMLGLQKQGKNMFYRDFQHHLQHSNDQLTIAPGIRGLVMLVFTLPSFPYVFKIIKDVFGSSKNMDRATVKSKYLLVKKHDRVGRMADTWEYSNVAFPLARFDAGLLAELMSLAKSNVEIKGNTLIINHVYIERRMKPLNLYLMQCNAEEKERVIIEYGEAIKNLATANIFPGDMLFKNFGVTRYGRVIFYDYDEIEYMTDCQFRDIPEAPNEDLEMSGEVWYPVGKYDVFPEEFATFLLADPEVRFTFLKHHKDLLQANYWQGRQARIRAGILDDFFPYPESVRFKNRNDWGR